MKRLFYILASFVISISAFTNSLNPVPVSEFTVQAIEKALESDLSSQKVKVVLSSILDEQNRISEYLIERVDIEADEVETTVKLSISIDDIHYRVVPVYEIEIVLERESLSAEPKVSSVSLTEI